MDSLKKINKVIEDILYINEAYEEYRYECSYIYICREIKRCYIEGRKK